ncbi:MAG: hypothetical protein ACI9JD_004279 [Rhodococcus sp. (in: high G+C Gram-positive bacteria)]|jgi:hypothetical protein
MVLRAKDDLDPSLRLAALSEPAFTVSATESKFRVHRGGEGLGAWSGVQIEPVPGSGFCKSRRCFVSTQRYQAPRGG